MGAITVRNLPPELARVIRQKAKKEKASLNRTVISLLEKATGLVKAENGRGAYRPRSILRLHIQGRGRRAGGGDSGAAADRAGDVEMSRILLDTSAYSAYTGGHPDFKSPSGAPRRSTSVVVAVGELLAGFLKGGRRRQNETCLRDFAAEPRVRVLHVDEETAIRYAAIRDYLRQQGTPVPVNDVLDRRHGGPARPPTAHPGCPLPPDPPGDRRLLRTGSTRAIAVETWGRQYCIDSQQICRHSAVEGTLVLTRNFVPSTVALPKTTPLTRRNTGKRLRTNVP